MQRLKKSIVSKVKADPALIGELAVTNKVSPATVINHLARNTEELTKLKYLWPIGRKLGFENIPLCKLEKKMCEQKV